ncbi:MAG: hypothetical protein IKV53_00390 [Clostridia bacterium]|nr:hypothetical protein [Clostridia bacterium]
MREIYLDIMERALSAYDDERIADFIDRVKRDGLTEHGFPRIAANIGILMANGRCERYFPVFCEIMDLCTEYFLKVKAANEFSVREVVCSLALLEKRGRCPKELIEKWRERIAKINPWDCYMMIARDLETHIGNWALFGAVSEYVRLRWCGLEINDFVESQLANQIRFVDENGMYMDPNCPMVYDLVPRMLFNSLLRFGYDGVHKRAIEDILDKGLDLELKMQSVNGEIAYGGRSSQFYHNEPLLTSIFEMEACRLAERGDFERASVCRAAAIKSAEYTRSCIFDGEFTHIKNYYDKDSFIGSEPYGYFDKYMITLASNLSFAYFFAREDIKPSVAVCEKGGYCVSTSDFFHKTFLNSNGYFLEFDTEADFHYDANGLGRVHKNGCPSQLCLSLPCPPKTDTIRLEWDNPRGMSLAVWCENDGKILYGSEKYAKYTLLSSGDNFVEYLCDMKGVTVKARCSLSEGGVDITLEGKGRVGLVIPLFEFDGKNKVEHSFSTAGATVEYKDCLCRYTYDESVVSDEGVFCNRNGRYRFVRVESRGIHVEMGRKYEI